MWANIRDAPISFAFFLRLPPVFPWKRNLLLLSPLMVLVSLTGITQGFWGDAPRLFFAALRVSYPDITTLMRTLSDYTTLAFYCGYLGIFVQSLILHNKERTYFTLRFTVYTLLFSLLTHMIKEFAGMPRPGYAFPLHPFSFGYAYSSFPSGHTVAAISAIVPMALWIGRGWASVLSSLLITGVGLSRLWLGAHHPVDILGSVVLGGIAVRYMYQPRKSASYLG
jgi:undecaprenyl-diphosphatase